jgi:hypothetical protein
VGTAGTVNERCSAVRRPSAQTPIRERVIPFAARAQLFSALSSRFSLRPGSAPVRRSKRNVDRRPKGSASLCVLRGEKRFWRPMMEFSPQRKRAQREFATLSGPVLELTPRSSTAESEAPRRPWDEPSAAPRTENAKADKNSSKNESTSPHFAVLDSVARSRTRISTTVEKLWILNKIAGVPPHEHVEPSPRPDRASR